MNKVTVGISNHHVHVTKEVFETLFGTTTLHEFKKLNQVGEFASNETVTIKTSDYQIDHVRIVGPFRTYNQVEISARDARTLKVQPPVRRSKDIKGSLPVTLIGPSGSVALEEGLILAIPHIHMNKLDAKNYGVEDNEEVTVFVNHTERKGSIKAMIEVSDNGYYELHIDTDEAFAFLLNNHDEVEWSK